ncbi:AAA family ATPase [Pseudomonas segetis]|uniref:Predicted ATPase n=1 Tax=Pseudomonas segetis TaxID=298908 RepID=A0A238Z8M8_9PSED|nr:AAA family ATPase [Pseudomonas segetis]SNR79836.1 Predicted ATPase [Pseudomonas segetis]
MNNFIVFTGGPGSGKTAVIEQIKALGHRCRDEVGRMVIRQQQELGADALPWKNKTAFRDEMVRAEIASYNQQPTLAEPVFFDRGIIDCLGYSLLEGLELPAALISLANSITYSRHVFIFPPWKHIYENDAERKQSFAQAVQTYKAMLKVYQQFGYELIEVPQLSISQRAGFILDRLSLDSQS